MNQSKHIIKSAGFAVLSQGVSFLCSIVLSFILPKLVSIETFGYWQLFLLYTSYVGILHFGFNDGLYLELGGQRFEEVDKHRWYPQMLISIFSQFILACGLAVFASCYVFEESIKSYLLLLLSIFIIFENTFKLLTFYLLATDRVVFYSNMIIVSKLFLMFTVLPVVLLYPSVSVIILVSIFVTSSIIVLSFTFTQFRDIPRYVKEIDKQTFQSYIYTSATGFILTLSNLLSSFLLGSGRFYIEAYWNIEIFAKISFALTVSTFLLFFISQVSYVIFPFLRNASSDTQRNLLTHMTYLLSILPFLAYILFFPLLYLLRLYLPNYEESFYYLVLLAPLSLFDIKINLIFNTYFKNLKKIKALFVINVLCVCVAVFFYAISARALNLTALVLSMLVSVMLRSFLMQAYIFRCYNLKQSRTMILEAILTFVFIIVFLNVGMAGLIITYIVVWILLGFMQRKRLKAIFNTIKSIS